MTTIKLNNVIYKVDGDMNAMWNALADTDFNVNIHYSNDDKDVTIDPIVWQKGNYMGRLNGSDWNMNLVDTDGLAFFTKGADHVSLPHVTLIRYAK